MNPQDEFQEIQDAERECINRLSYRMADAFAVLGDVERHSVLDNGGFTAGFAVNCGFATDSERGCGYVEYLRERKHNGEDGFFVVVNTNKDDCRRCLIPIYAPLTGLLGLGVMGDAGDDPEEE